jgi:hypothetical protein
MNLNDLKKKTPTTGWFTFDKSGVELELQYESPADVRARVERCTETVNGRERTDNDKMQQETAKLILAWRGLTLAKAAELMELEIPEGADLATALPCNEENKLALLSESWALRPWLEQKTMALSDFVAAKREAERKNSLPSPSGGSAAA